MNATARMRGTRPAIPRLSPPRPRTIVALALALALLGGGWLWVRDSPLVSVDRVTVSGLSGPSSAAIQSALLSVARSMTTLDVNMSALRTAVAPFPVVKTLSVSTELPHGMRIQVTEQVPVGAVTAGGRKIAVAGDGMLLPSVNAAGLASIPVSVPPGGTRLTDGAARGAVAVLAAAPGWLRARVSQVSQTSAHGLVAQMRNGPAVYFGPASELPAKWTAVAVILAAAGAQGAVYVDVTLPSRPAAGGVPGGATGSPSSLSGASGNGAPTVATGGTATTAAANGG